MILNENLSSPVLSNGVGESKKMGILANGKVFKIISDTLYQNKIGSCVRELSCNSVDGMKKAGRGDIPFDLHVPTVFEPWFAVKDTGVGMSHDTVMNVFANYFASTKDQSNDEIGGFGLGAKTPFCYTDSFIVVSIFDGKRTTYSFMMNEQGEPTGTVLGEEDCSEHNGVEVRFDVEQNDIHKFSNEIRNQLRFFAVKPNLSTPNIEIDEVEYLNNGVDFPRMRVPENLRGLWVVQGGVGYPLNYQLIQDKLTDSERTFFRINDNLVMHFNIGEIEVIPSREAISYGKSTIDNIKNLIASAVPVMTQAYIDSANGFTEPKDFCTWYESNHLIRQMLKVGNYDPATAPALKGLNFDFRNGSPFVKLNVDFTFNGKPARMPVMSLGYNGRKSYSNPDSDGNYTYRFSQIPIIFIRDKCTAAVGRIRDFRNSYNQNFVVIEHPHGTEYVDSTFVDLVKKQLPYADIRMVSSLTAPEKSENAKRGTPVVYSKTKHDRFDSIAKWERLYDEEEIEGGYYLVFDSYPFIENNLTSDEQSLLQLMMEAGMIDKPIIAIKKAKLDMIADNPSFEPLRDRIKTLAAQAQQTLFQSTVRLDRYIEAKRLMGDVSDYMNRTGLHHVKKAGLSVRLLARAERLDRICNRYLDNVQKVVQLEGNSLNEHLFNEYQRSYNQKKYETKLDAESFRAKYPMLKFSHLGYCGDSKEYGNIVAQYIAMVDNHAE